MLIEKALIYDRLRVSKVSCKFRIPTIYNFAVNLPIKFSFFLKSSLLLKFLLSFLFKTKLYGSITQKLEQLWMQKFWWLLLMLKQSCICYYVISMTVPLSPLIFLVYTADPTQTTLILDPRYHPGNLNILIM